MSKNEWLFFVAILLNTIIAIAYMLWGILSQRTKEETGNGRIAYVFRGVCMLICPVIGILFFLTGKLFRKMFFRGQVDLEDVLFSKERVRQMVKADEEREKNLVPIEEALKVTDSIQLRKLMLNVLKGDIETSLYSIALALNSQDSETSHYAASVLSKELDTFRVNVRKLEKQLENEEEQDNRAEYAWMLFRYMNPMLKQQVFTEVEQKYFVEVMEKAGRCLYEEQNKEEYAALPEEENYCAEVAQRLMEQDQYQKADVWCTRALELYPGQYSSYQCRLKYLFDTDEKEKFLQVLDELRSSGIEIDNETLEMIRIFQ